jgi:DNA-binding MarR family transcriptional regulator
MAAGVQPARRTAEQIAQVRRFNRLVTQRAGALDDHFLGRDRPLGESRVLFEIGERGTDLRELRARLGLDSGYLSRLAQALASKKLIKLRSDSSDERVRRAELTRSGRAELAEMNRRSDQLAEGILAELPAPQREHLVTAMADVCRLLGAASARFEVVDPTSAAARWCLEQYFAELAERFESGFEPGKSLPVDDAELRLPRGVFLIATVDGEAVASGCVKTIAPAVGYLKRMWVAASVRGLGFGRRMLAALESQARELGLATMRLETNRTLVEAIRLYRSGGYVEVPPFNDEPYAHHWFEKRL